MVRFDGRTGRPLVPLTAEERREHVQRVIASNRQWLREQVWWRRAFRRMIDTTRSRR